MKRAHPIGKVPDLDTTKPFTLVPSEAVLSSDSSGYDARVIVGHLTGDSCLKSAGAEIVNAVSAQAKIDSALFAPGASFINANGERLIVSPTGPLNRCEDDVRRFSEAAEAGIKRALKCGAKAPLLMVFPDSSMEKSLLVSILGAFNALYTTLELRESEPAKAFKANKMGVWSSCGTQSATLKTAVIIEESKTVTRDLQGSDPERMNPENFNKYCERLFQIEDTNVFISTISGAHMIKEEYPCMAAVDRACQHIDRHRARAIWLNYSEGKPEKTIVLVGKGITYDTGGADIKAGGIMAGMHRDKGGASAVAGFMHAINLLKPKNVQICAGLAVCRNSVGSEAYVADEIIKARSGIKLRVGNTDAEGRMAMVDLLCYAKERCLNEKWADPEFYTIATLTGHAKLAYGSYSGIVANGPYHRAKLDRKLQESGETVGDQFDVGTLRREDFEYHIGKDEQTDVLQAGNNPSTRTPRGHQGPAAFLILTSGLKNHGLGTDKPIKYAHLDIAGSCGPFPGLPTAAPITALLNHYFL